MVKQPIDRDLVALHDAEDALRDAGFVEQLSKEEKKALAGAFQTEAQKTEAFQKFVRQALDGVRQVGTALFDIIMAGLAELVLSVRYMVAILKGEDKTAAAYGQAMREAGKLFGPALGRAWEGLKDIGGAGENFLGSVEGLQPLRKALEGIGEEDDETPTVMLPPSRINMPSGEGAGTGDPSTLEGVNQSVRDAAAQGSGGGGGRRASRGRGGNRFQSDVDAYLAQPAPTQQTGSATVVIGTNALATSAARHKAVRSGRVR